MIGPHIRVGHCTHGELCSYFTRKRINIQRVVNDITLLPEGGPGLVVVSSVKLIPLNALSISGSIFQMMLI